MSNLPWWASEDFWRKTAIWVTAGMAVVLIVLTFDTVKVITAGHSRVPAYEVINKRIYYRMNTKRQFQEPVIGADAPRVGKMLSPEEAKAMAKARLVQRLTWVDGELAGKQYLMGDAFSVADAYLFTVSNWAGFVALDISGLAHLNAYRARVGARPAVQAALKAEGLGK